ncbi:hypothetical protein [Mycetocola saprophilus]|uniref:hypothetical protein n=1 Tax=Mycetocola saprophilus TaxID=76636 RepID=UPI0012DE4E15|nr:hypothetical protein [Mycetocola saprophilus]
MSEEQENTPQRTLEDKLAWALHGKARWEHRLERANAMTESAHEMGGGIPGFGRSGNQRAARQVGAATDRAYKAWKEATGKVAYYDSKARSYQLRIAERDRVRLERADIIGARVVRTRVGWHKVARINVKTVSVETGYSWVDRYPFAEILEARQ